MQKIEVSLHGRVQKILFPLNESEKSTFESLEELRSKIQTEQQRKYTN